jgi:hypothetical protein
MNVRVFGLFVRAFFLSPSVTQPFAAHWSDTEPAVGSESENRASVSLLPPSPLSRFSLSLGFQCAVAHGSLSPRL